VFDDATILEAKDVDRQTSLWPRSGVPAVNHDVLTLCHGHSGFVPCLRRKGRNEVAQAIASGWNERIVLHIVKRKKRYEKLRCAYAMVRASMTTVLLRSRESSTIINVPPNGPPEG
jgi:hypothetical protein